MDSDFPWVYVAMIFIAFVSWVRARLQEAAELRRAKALKKESARTERRPAPGPVPVSPYLDPSPQPSRSRPAIPDPNVVEPDGHEVPKTFRELFEVLQGELTGQTETPTNRQSAPPPLPVSPPAKTEVPFSPAAPKLPELTPHVSTYSYQKQRTRRKTSGELSRILKTRGTLREALIMKEILDTPVALRD